MDRILKFVLFIVFLLSISCRVQKTVVKEDYKIKNISDGKLVKNIADNELLYNNLYFKKLEVEVKIDDHDYSFKGNLNILKDSQIVVSVIPLMGIEMFRIAFFRDSITLIDRTKKKVYHTDYKYFERRYNIDLDFYSLQSILTNAIFCFPYEKEGFDCIKKFKSYSRADYYALQSVKSRRMVRMDRKDVVDHIFQEFLIDPESFKISHVAIQKFSSNDLLEVNYSEFTTFESDVFPKFINIKGKHSSKEFLVSLEINGFVKNSEQQLMFNVPEKYQNINSY